MHNGVTGVMRDDVIHVITHYPPLRFTFNALTKMLSNYS